MEQLSGLVGVELEISPSASSALAPAAAGEAQADPQLMQLADDADSLMNSSLRKTSSIEVFMLDALDSGPDSPPKTARKRRAGSANDETQPGPDQRVECVDDSGRGTTPEPEPDKLAPTARSRPASPSPSSSPPRQRPRLKPPPPHLDVGNLPAVDGIGVAPDGGCGVGEKLQDPVLPAPAAAAPAPAFEPPPPPAPQVDATPTIFTPPPPDDLTSKDKTLSPSKDKTLSESRTNVILQQAKAHEKLAGERIIVAVNIATATATNLRATASSAGASSNPGKGGGAPPRRGGTGATAATAKPPARLSPAVTLMLADAAQRKAAAAASTDNAKPSAHTTIQVDHHVTACQVFNLMGKCAFRAAAAARKPQQRRRADAAAGGAGSGEATGRGCVGDHAGGTAQVAQQQDQEQRAVAPAAEAPQPQPAGAVVAAVVGAGDLAMQAAVADPLSPGPFADVETTTAALAAPPALRPLQPWPAPSIPPPSSAPLDPVPGWAFTTCPAAPASCPPATTIRPAGALAGGTPAHGGALPQQWLPVGGIAGFFSGQTKLPTITTAVVTDTATPPAGTAGTFNGNASSANPNVPAGAVPADGVVINAPCYKPGGVLTPTAGGATVQATAGAPLLPCPCPGNAHAAGTLAPGPGPGLPCDATTTSYCASTAVAPANTAAITTAAAAAAAIAADTDFGGCGVGAVGTCGDDVPMPDSAPPLLPPPPQQLSDLERMRLIHDAFSLDASPGRSPTTTAKPCPNTATATTPDFGLADTVMSEADARADGAWADCDDAFLGGGVLTGNKGGAGDARRVSRVSRAGGGGGGFKGGEDGERQEPDEPGQLVQVPAHLLPPSDSEVVVAGRVVQPLPLQQQQQQLVAAAVAPAGMDPPVAAAAEAVGEADGRITVTLKPPPLPLPPPQKQQPERQPRLQEHHHHHANPRLNKTVPMAGALLAQQERHNEGDSCLLTRTQQHPHPLLARAALPDGACATGAAAAAAMLNGELAAHTVRDPHAQVAMDAAYDLTTAAKGDARGVHECDANPHANNDFDAWLRSILNEDEVGCYV
ncbi:hypothetical protein HYH02_013892 [Chlamydomonas schloesseri]|uniref:Uncharacterized protein n=1 Tax=Chlamydomonas schloesseri TaxID=2026947 RepID=A0A835VYQ6_9CHLO|nr:hypothetical protein HYH02_013892 [Chlamydomonas schloesseri]|eukprot:KAG2429941.1 hypothetical protein HYH02_013892 [Chlamydomonas schloesseri]